MQVTPLSIEGSWRFEPIIRGDERGEFFEGFTQQSCATAIGRHFPLAQMNVSTSKHGTIRGIHFADVPPGQAKYVQCLAGRIMDIVVDIRVGSPTFGTWEAVELDDVEHHGLFLAEGLGHAFCALTPTATVAYLCSTPYNPAGEHGIHPQDPSLNLPWPDYPAQVLSPKDEQAPTLAQALASGILPNYQECSAWYLQRG